MKDFIRQVHYTNGFRDISNVIWIPDRHPRLEAELKEGDGSLFRGFEMEEEIDDCLLYEIQRTKI